MNNIYRYGLALGACGLGLCGLAGHQVHHALSRADSDRSAAEQAQAKAEAERDTHRETIAGLRARIDAARSVLALAAVRQRPLIDSEAVDDVDIDSLLEGCELSVADCVGDVNQVCESYRKRIAVKATADAPHPDPAAFAMCKDSALEWCKFQSVSPLGLAQAAQSNLAAQALPRLVDEGTNTPELVAMAEIVEAALGRCNRRAQAIEGARALVGGAEQ